MTKLPDTFCQAPWTSVKIDMDCTLRPCNLFRTARSEFGGTKTFNINETAINEWRNNEYLTYIKESMLAGDKIKECGNCWEKESHDFDSMRGAINNIIGEIKDSGDLKDGTKFADISTTNNCNFSCIMCNPSNSSQILSRWAKDIENEFVQEKFIKYPNYIRDIQARGKPLAMIDEIMNDESLEYIKLLGGEPFLDIRLIEKLAAMPKRIKNNVNLKFSTNGSINLVDIMVKLGEFKKVDLSVSLEGIGDVQDYLRKGSKWETVKTNILQFRDLSSDRYYIDIGHTIQTLSIENLHQLLDWTREEDLPLQFNILSTPRYLSTRLLEPKYIKNQCLSLNSKLFKKNDGTLTSLNFSDYLTEFPYDSSLLERFKRFVEWYEQDSKLKMKDVTPKLYEYCFRGLTG